MMRKPLPCPFCGSHLIRVVERKPEHIPVPPLYRVQCEKCGASSASSDEPMTAVEYWNRRVPGL